MSWTELAEGYAGAWFDSTYGDVKQRWLLVKSAQATAREGHLLDAKIKRETTRSVKSFKKLCRQAFACEQDAKTAYEDWLAAQRFIRVDDKQIIPIVTRAKRGRPRADGERQIHFQLQGTLVTDLKQRAEAQQQTGLFILSTNDLSDSFSMQFVLDEYKSQQAVECGFRFLKSPDFLTSSLFLKKPERIEALLMIMTCSLMVYAAIERLIRQKLTQTNTFFPDMKNKPTQRPTARWVFFCFQGIHVVIIDNQTQWVTNLADRHRIILDCLGKLYWEFYS